MHNITIIKVDHISISLSDSPPPANTPPHTTFCLHQWLTWCALSCSSRTAPNHVRCLARNVASCWVMCFIWWIESVWAVFGGSVHSHTVDTHSDGCSFDVVSLLLVDCWLEHIVHRTKPNKWKCTELQLNFISPLTKRSLIKWALSP